MKDKLKIIETTWDQKAEEARKTAPLKALKSLPKMEGITSKTRKNLRAKGLFYLLKYDKEKIFPRYVLKNPLKYGLGLLRSYTKKESFTRDKDLFFYGLPDIKTFKKKAKNAHVIIGFSYCHKPFECPSGRFTDKCENSPTNPVCNQCFIGKCSKLASYKDAKLLYIPTIHYIGEKILEETKNHPDREILFLITACELSLTMFADWGNMIQAKGIGIRLDGRICNTMRAFKLSEEGIKPGLTVVLDETQQIMLDLIRNLPSI